MLSTVLYRYQTIQWTLAFQKYDPRAEYFNPVLDVMFENGLMDRMLSVRLPYLDMKEQGLGLVSKEKVLAVEHFYLPLMFLAAGCVLAGIAVSFEACNNLKSFVNVLYVFHCN